MTIHAKNIADNAAIKASQLKSNDLLGTQVANTADGNAIGGLQVIHRYDVAAGVTANLDKTLTHKERIIDMHLVKTVAAGGGAGTIALQTSAGTAITDAVSIDIADKTIGRVTTIDDAQHEIAAGGTLRIRRVRTASTDESCIVYVSCLRVV